MAAFVALAGNESNTASISARVCSMMVAVDRDTRRDASAGFMSWAAWNTNRS